MSPNNLATSLKMSSKPLYSLYIMSKTVQKKFLLNDLFIKLDKLKVKEANYKIQNISIKDKLDQI